MITGYKPSVKGKKLERRDLPSPGGKNQCRDAGPWPFLCAMPHMGDNLHQNISGSPAMWVAACYSSLCITSEVSTPHMGDNLHQNISGSPAMWVAACYSSLCITSEVSTQVAALPGREQYPNHQRKMRYEARAEAI